MMMMPRGSARVCIRWDGDRHERKGFTSQASSTAISPSTATTGLSIKAIRLSKKRRFFYIVYQFTGFSLLIGRRRGQPGEGEKSE
jgi:hypothetical protein